MPALPRRQPRRGICASRYQVSRAFRYLYLSTIGADVRQLCARTAPMFDEASRSEPSAEVYGLDPNKQAKNPASNGVLTPAAAPVGPSVHGSDGVGVVAPCLSQTTPIGEDGHQRHGTPSDPRQNPCPVSLSEPSNPVPNSDACHSSSTSSVSRMVGDLDRLARLERERRKKLGPVLTEAILKEHFPDEFKSWETVRRRCQRGEYKLDPA